MTDDPLVDVYEDRACDDGSTQVRLSSIRVVDSVIRYRKRDVCAWCDGHDPEHCDNPACIDGYETASFYGYVKDDVMALLLRRDRLAQFAKRRYGQPELPDSVSDWWPK